jgi:hypothetical protein
MHGLKAAAILAAILCGGTAAQAQVSPAPAATPAPAPTAATPATASSAPLSQPGGDATADQIADWLKSAPTGDPDAPDAGIGPRQIHGEVGLSVSNRGYGGYAAASMPIGQASELDVAVGGGHESLPHGGSVNPRSLSIGLYLDGRDVNNWLSHDKCQQHTGVRLRGDPVLMADGTCARPDPKAAAEDPPGS